jgi:hypothetical protein
LLPSTELERIYFASSRIEHQKKNIVEAHQLLSPLSLLKRKQGEERLEGEESISLHQSSTLQSQGENGDQRGGRGGLHDSLELEFLTHKKKKKGSPRIVAFEEEEEDDMDTMTTNDQIETNGPPTAGDREMAFHSLRSKMGHLEEVIEDIGQFICENQLEDHFINFVFRLSSVSKELNTEISTVESYLEFIVSELSFSLLLPPANLSLSSPPRNRRGTTSPALATQAISLSFRMR